MGLYVLLIAVLDGANHSLTNVKNFGIMYSSKSWGQVYNVFKTYVSELDDVQFHYSHRNQFQPTCASGINTQSGDYEVYKIERIY